MKEKILIILLLFSIIKCQNRTLQNEQIQKICSKCESNFNEIYKDSELLNNTSDDDKINEYVKFLVEMVKDDFNSSQLIDQYVTPRVINPNIIFFIFIIALIIIWIILIIVVCLNKKCLNFKASDNTFKHHLLAYITMILFIAVIVISSICLSHVYKSQVYFSGTICSLLRIYVDIRDGDQAKTTEWKGIRNLQKDINANENTINQLENYIDLQTNIATELKNNKYQEKTFDENEKNNKYYSNLEVTSPSSIKSKVYPKYSKNRFEQLTAYINLDYFSKLSLGVDKNEEMAICNQLIKSDPTKIVELVKNDYLYINRKLDSILETVQLTAEEYLQYLIDYSNYINNIAFPLLYIIFILSIIFALAGIILLFLNIREKKTSLKAKKIISIILHVLWNMFLFILLIIIISQILFKIFEIYGEDGSGLVQYATSEENFENSDSIIFKGSGKVFLEVCFKDENASIYAEIIKDMDYKNSIFSKFDNVVKNVSVIIANQFLKQMQEIDFSNTKKLINDLENMNNDYSLISYYPLLISISSDCQDDFDDLNQYTDYSNPLISKQNKDLSKKHTYDVWTSKKENCKNYKDYKYINTKDDRIEGNKYCMVISEFDMDVAKSFYSDIKASLIINVADKFEDYYQALNKFEEDNKKLLNEDPNFIGMTKTYYNELIEIKEKVIKGFEYSIQIYSLINKLMGGSSNIAITSDIFSVTNCFFLKRDIKVFYIEMEKLRANSAPFLTISLFALLLFLISAVLIILNIYKYKGKEEEKIEQLPSNSTLMED